MKILGITIKHKRPGEKQLEYGRKARRKMGMRPTVFKSKDLRRCRLLPAEVRQLAWILSRLRYASKEVSNNHESR